MSSGVTCHASVGTDVIIIKQYFLLLACKFTQHINNVMLE